MSHTPGQEQDQASGPVTREQKVIGLAVSVIAIVLAITSMIGNKAKSEEMLKRIELNDGWSFYQAKRVRRSIEETATDQISLTRRGMAAEEQAAADRILSRYAAEIEKYKGENNELETKAKDIEQELSLLSRKIEFYEVAETILHVAIVLCSITLLTSQRWFFRAGVGLAAGAALIVAAGYWMVH